MKDTKLSSEPAKTDLIEDWIRPYAIGEKLRSLRQRKSLGLAQLAALTVPSAAMLSKLENARLVPTLPTLVRIATVFNVDAEKFRRPGPTAMPSPALDPDQSTILPELSG